jgi:hypothetical protein
MCLSGFPKWYVVFFFMFREVIWEVFVRFCWYWWNCWPSPLNFFRLQTHLFVSLFIEICLTSMLKMQLFLNFYTKKWGEQNHSFASPHTSERGEHVPPDRSHLIYIYFIYIYFTYSIYPAENLKLCNEWLKKRN